VATFVRPALLFCLALLSIPALASSGWQQPTPDELKMTADPAAPDAAAVFLYRSETVDDHLHNHTLYVRMKILTEKGRELADVEMPTFDRRSYNITNIEGRTIHSDGTTDGTVRIDNPGLTYGNLCANIYVFAADQQMAECCSCVQSHNNLTTFSVFRNLASPNFTLTGEFTPNGVIKIISSLPVGGVCDASGSYKPTANVRAWATHIQNPVGAAFPITETEFSDSTLGATELANLQAQCSFIHILGSGFGICSCAGGGAS
jgi:hypothetical protein